MFCFICFQHLLCSFVSFDFVQASGCSLHCLAYDVFSLGHGCRLSFHLPPCIFWELIITFFQNSYTGHPIMPFICDFFGLDNHERTSDVMKVLNKHRFTGQRESPRWKSSFRPELMFQSSPGESHQCAIISPGVPKKTCSKSKSKLQFE